ncbi:hypothetical protein HDA32_000166 [Spinactinospora alkalitolerans]|uniref:Pyrroloquinoline-quinone binding quinoprotein n=1 Tax=Spinactinospora alkalitolerans TaxID=687207 RepID=A0A852TLD9_9ACTN|nr:hypothetical protein [Spinactinospora alkalitolerans]NYE45046.1 hypothetical protein [Spinactinospora alkalitolerans]
MRTWRAPLVPATAFGLLLGAVACTGDPPPEPPEESPRPIPTAYSGEAPPGLAGDPVRFLHGPEAGGPDIVDDPMGVRIQGLGDAFLISSNSEERHLLQDAASGEALWEGDRHVGRFTSDGDGTAVFELSEGSAHTVVDDTGEEVWSGSDPREVYVNGWVVRRPEGWSADEPHGEFTVSDPGGGTAWSYAFDRPEPQEEPEEGEESEESEEADAEADPDPDRMGAPVGARGDVVLLDDGAGLLQARDAGADGELLWSTTGDDLGVAGDGAVSRPQPRPVGFYELPLGEEERDEEQEEAESGDGGTASPSPAEESLRKTVLVRWGLPEDPSTLSLHDLRSGEVLWSLAEPGANPGDAFAAALVPGTVHDAATHTLLLPQGSGTTPMIAVDLVAGEIRWRFDDDTERAISPSFALDGYVYGDSRGVDGDSQVVLEAGTKDVVSDDPAGYVEARTADGHAMVVQDRQRFVFAPENPPTPAPTSTPSPSG